MGLYNTMIKHANRFVEMCQGISGEIGNITIDPDYEVPKIDIPIDTLLLDFTIRHQLQQHDQEDQQQVEQQEDQLMQQTNNNDSVAVKV